MEHWGSPSGSPKFSFAFNDRNFSDRILRIEVVGSSSSIMLEEVTAARGSEWGRNRKRRLNDPKKDPAVETVIDFGDEEEEIMVQQEDDDGADSNDDSPVPMIEEASSQDQMLAGTCENDHETPGMNTPWIMESPAVSRVKTLHISSAILAAESRFFFKLFSNGMRESEQRDVTLRINASEESALMDMLQFMYTGRLEASSSPALLDVLMTADKFEVASCMRHCSKLLGKLPMTPESALLYLDLPSSMLLAEAMQPLTDAARSFLISQYKDIMRYQDDVMSLPLAGIEALFSSDELQIASEDSVYDFVLKWAKVHYPNIEERREVVGHKLSLIRFPLMTSRKLRKVLASLELEHDIASKFVLEALFYKSEPAHRQRQLAMEEPACKKYTERAYKYRPVKVVEFERPFTQCIVFLDLKKEECVALYPQGRVYSQAFHLGGQGFFLSAHCNMDQAANFHCFGLFLGMQEKGSMSFSVDYEFSARGKPSGEFMMKYRGTYKFTGGKAVGYRNLFGMPWSEFVGDDCIYFIDDVLHLRAELTVRVGVDV